MGPLVGGVGRTSGTGAARSAGAARCAGDPRSAGGFRRTDRNHAPGGWYAIAALLPLGRGANGDRGIGDWRAIATLLMLGHGAALLAGPAGGQLVVASGAANSLSRVTASGAKGGAPLTVASTDSQPAADDTPYKWHLPRGFPTPAVPADNVMSAAKVALGRRLFFEPRLSITGQYSCASCHEPGRAYTDGRALAIGATGQSLIHSAMSLVNVAYNISFGWTNPSRRPGRRPELQSLESQMLEPLLNEHPVELGLAGRQASVCDLLAADPGYRAGFARAFPQETSARAAAGAGTPAGASTNAGVGTPAGASGDNARVASAPVSFENIVKAIAAFERTSIFGDSPFDRYVFGGDHDAISAPAKRGMQLFYSPKAGCGSCHSGFNFNGNWRDSQGDTGKPGFANNGIGDQLMRVPTLRNIALTAPYMHDGRFATLDAVLDHYAHVAELPASDAKLRTFNLSADERADLIAFLHSLTDAEFSGR
jgi:cytochrome c peroxidase